jgi:hypothetical protein
MKTLSHRRDSISLLRLKRGEEPIQSTRIRAGLILSECVDQVIKVDLLSISINPGCHDTKAVEMRVSPDHSVAQMDSDRLSVKADVDPTPLTSCGW